MFDKILYALKNPNRLKVFLRWNTVGRFRSFLSRIECEQQSEKIEDLVEEDEFLLIVLDACRYDYFSEHYSDFFEGEIEKVYSEGRNTFEYLSGIWRQNYEDILYISGNPAVNSKQGEEWGKSVGLGDSEYVPEDHLRISNIWEDLWDDNLFTVPPEELAKSSSSRLSIEDKVVLHFNQPHAPYIGDFRIKEVQGDKILNANQSFERLSKGEVSESEIRKAYRSNLIEALGAIQSLVSECEKERIVITSDHGELFGEGGMVGHPDKENYLLREVPWLEIKGISEEKEMQGF